MKNTKLNAITLLFLLGFIWGTGYSIARFATTHGVSPLGYSFWQSFGPAILMSLFASKSFASQKTTVSHIRYYLISGLTGIVIPNTNMYFAAPHLPAGLLAVIVNTVPIIAYPLAIFARLETFNMVRLIGVGCAVAGLMLIVLPLSSLPSPAMTPWALSALITPCSFAFCAVYISRYRPNNTDSSSLAAGTLIASSILLVPLVLISKSFYLPHWPFGSQDGVILLEIILSSVGYILFFQLLKIAGPVYYSLVDTIVALTGLFWGYVLFHEKLNQFTASAVLLIFIALFLVTKRQKSLPIRPQDKMVKISS